MHWHSDETTKCCACTAKLLPFWKACTTGEILSDRLRVLSLCREELEYIANTLIFVLSGALITSRIWESATVHSVDDIRAVDFAYAILLWVYLLVGTIPLSDYLYSCYK